MNYLGITKDDIANGTGVRCVLWVAGCDIHCDGCHNPESWSFCGGKPFDDSVMEELIEYVNRPWIKGITISGGNPLSRSNLPGVYEICKTIRDRIPGKDIWLYTGYSVSSDDFVRETSTTNDDSALFGLVLSMCDVVVDGKYDKSLRDTTLKFRGSSNQRIIDVKETVSAGRIIVAEE